MSYRAALKFFFVFVLVLAGVVTGARAQARSAATVRGTVSDPDNAVIPGATVTLTPPKGNAILATSQADGTYVMKAVPPGTYSITVTMLGFTSFVKQGLKIAPGQVLDMDAKLAIEMQSQQVQVTTENTTLSVDSDSNASATVISGKDLDALSDDPDELSTELSALAGPAAGPSGGQIYVDGFTGGQLPPKSSIREIRVNQNPFTAQYDRIGYGRVEVFTKPGSGDWHGFFQALGNDNVLNTTTPLLNAYLSPGQSTVTQPPYYTTFFLGNLTGPISKKVSFTLSGSHRTIQDNSIINATVLSSVEPCPAGQTVCSYQNADPFPQSRFDISPRIDWQLGEKNTLVTRFQLYRNETTSNGTGGFDLPTTAYNTGASEYELQVSDTQLYGQKIINETRFELGRNRDSQDPQSQLPTLFVQGAFNGGGNSLGSNSSREARLEVQNYTSAQLSKNFVRFGGRLRANRESSYSNAGGNGIFTYSSLADYQNNAPSLYSQTQTLRGVVATLYDIGIYAEDDWRARPNLTITYGLRYEMQNQINDTHDFAPRLSFAYGLGNSKSSPKTVIRGGFGIFYDRFKISNVLNTLQENGVNQIQTVISHPQAGCSPSNVNGCNGGVTANNTTYTIAPNLRTPYTTQFAIGLERQLFAGVTLTVNYLNSHGVHQYLSENMNAPVNGVYPLPPASGGTPLTLYQYQSEGVYRQNQLITSVNGRTKHVTVFSFYTLNFAKSDTSGASTFPSVPYHIGADYGRATFDTRNRIFVGGNVTLPYGISVAPFMAAQSGAPYNITVGRDLNSDTIFNDRPTFLPGQSSARCLDPTSFAIPAPGTTYTPIPINYCTGSALFAFNMRLTKTFGFGNKAGAARPGGGPGGPQAGSMAGRIGPQGGGGGGHGGGGMFGGGGASTGKKYNVTLGLQFQNLFQTINYGSPIGTLSSPEFGKSTQLAGNIYTPQDAAPSRILLTAAFQF